MLLLWPPHSFPPPKVSFLCLSLIWNSLRFCKWLCSFVPEEYVLGPLTPRDKPCSQNSIPFHKCVHPCDCFRLSTACFDCGPLGYSSFTLCFHVHTWHPEKTVVCEHVACQAMYWRWLQTYLCYLLSVDKMFFFPITIKPFGTMHLPSEPWGKKDKKCHVSRLDFQCQHFSKPLPLHFSLLDSWRSKYYLFCLCFHPKIGTVAGSREKVASVVTDEEQEARIRWKQKRNLS